MVGNRESKFQPLLIPVGKLTRNILALIVESDHSQNLHGFITHHIPQGREKIQASPNLPEDFTKFWEDGIQALDKIPPDVKLELLPKYSTPQFDCFKISFANIDNTRIYGFLSVPKDKKGPFPALVNVPGAGPGHCNPDTGWVRNGETNTLSTLSTAAFYLFLYTGATFVPPASRISSSSKFPDPTVISGACQVI